MRCSIGSSARSVRAESPTRFTSVGYRMPIRPPSMSICTARAWPNSGMNWVYGKFEPTMSSVSQSRIIA